MAVEILDLTNYRDRFGSRVPEGDYLVQVEEIEVGQSNAKDPMWTVYLRIVGGESDGMTLVDRLTQTEKAMFRVVGFLHGMGVKTQRKKMRVDTDRLVGKKVRVSVSDGEPFRGTVRSEVNGYERFVNPNQGNDELDALEREEDEEEQVETTSAAPAPAAQEAAPEAPEVSEDRELDLDNLDL